MITDFKIPQFAAAGCPVPCERGPTPKLLNVGGGGISGSTKHQTRDAWEIVRENEVLLIGMLVISLLG